MAKTKNEPTAAEIELQLSERRFILEAMTTTATLLQVPLISAFIWFYLSRTNASLGVLNKAILSAELTPLIGDIKFPEGVLLGAAMESTEDMLGIMDALGVKIPDIPEIVKTEIEKLKNKTMEKTQDTGDFIANQIIKIIPDRKCDYWLNQVNENQPTLGKPLLAQLGSGVDWLIALKKLKAQGCEQPQTITDTTWELI